MQDGVLYGWVINGRRNLSPESHFKRWSLKSSDWKLNVLSFPPPPTLSQVRKVSETKRTTFQAVTVSDNRKLCRQKNLILSTQIHTSYLSRAPRVYSCKFFLAGVNFYRFNAKNWHFRQILCEKVAFFYRFNAKNWRFSV